MTEYRFPPWQRVTFLAVLIVILVLSLAPSITQGTINIRVYALIPQGVFSHVYTSFSSVQLHAAGFPQGTGLVTIQSHFARGFDMLPTAGKYVPGAILSTAITSGRYDSVTLSFSNSTLVLPRGQKTNIPTGPSLSANVTIAVPPNGNGDVLVVLSLDYSTLISATPSISATISQITSFS